MGKQMGSSPNGINQYHQEFVWAGIIGTMSLYFQANDD